MDPKLIDMRARTKCMLNKLEIYRESFLDILNIIDQVDAKIMPLEQALEQIDKKMDLIDEPVGMKLIN